MLAALSNEERPGLGGKTQGSWLSPAADLVWNVRLPPFPLWVSDLGSRTGLDLPSAAFSIRKAPYLPWRLRNQSWAVCGY